MIHGVIPILGVLSFWLDCNVRPSGIVLVIDHRFLHSLLEAHVISLLIPITVDQSQVDSVHHGLPLNSFHVFQIINTKFQVCNSPD
jgi:hypothetical protein